MDTFLQVFKILSDENRLRISMLLYEKPLCVGELREILGVSQPTVSKALTKLKDLNLVYNDKIEQFNLYYINEDKRYYKEILDRINHHIKDHPCLMKDRQQIDRYHDAPVDSVVKQKKRSHQMSNYILYTLTLFLLTFSFYKNKEKTLKALKKLGKHSKIFCLNF